MFNKMVDAERSAAVIHTVPDEVPSESRTDETVVPFRTALDLQHQIVFHVLSLLKCSVLVFSEAAGYSK